MNNPKLILPFFLGACFLGFALLFLSPPQAYWTEVGEANDQITALEAELEELGYKHYKDFIAMIDYNGGGNWEGYMTNAVPFGYHVKFLGSTPQEVYEEMKQALVIHNDPNLIPIDSFDLEDGVYLSPQKFN